MRQFLLQISACPACDAPPPLLIHNFGVRLEGDLSQKKKQKSSAYWSLESGCCNVL